MDLKIRNKELDIVQTIKYLGLQIDSSLDWKEQIKAVSTKVSRAVGFLKYAKSFLPMASLKTLYMGIVEPHFRYCCSVWGCCGSMEIHQLQKLQNRAARVITNSSFDAPSRPLIQELGWTTIEELINYETKTMVYKSLHDLLLAKLEAYGFSLDSLNLLHSYLTNRLQRVKINGTYSNWQQLKSGVPQGSVLGPSLFNPFINDFIYAVENSQVCNFADDNTIYSCEDSIDNILRSLKGDIDNALKWFKDNRMVANPDKFQVIFMGLEKGQKVSLEINGQPIKTTEEVKLLGITIDSKLQFHNHVEGICKKASQRVKAFSRIAGFLQKDKANILYKTFIKPAFNYCPLIWMFCGKTSNNRINRLHKRALRVLHGDYTSTFEELLARSEEITIHCSNLQKLMVEIYECSNFISPSILSEFFTTKEITYDLRIKNLLQVPKVKTSSYGQSSLSFRGSILWNTLSDSIKSAQNTKQFKTMIKNWKGEQCRCNVCK